MLGAKREVPETSGIGDGKYRKRVLLENVLRT